MIDRIYSKPSTIFDSRHYELKRSTPASGCSFSYLFAFRPDASIAFPIYGKPYASSATFSFWVASISMISSTRLW